MNNRDADPVDRRGRPHEPGRQRESRARPRVVVDPRHAEKLHAREPGDLIVGCQARGQSGGQGQGRTARTHGGEESDGVVLPMKQANNVAEEQAAAAESVEGRTPDQGEHQSGTHAPGTGRATRVPGPGGCAGSGKGEEAGTVHELATPSDHRSAAEQFPTNKEGSGAGSGRGEVGGV